MVFVSTALAGQIVGLKQEGILRWRAHFFGVDLGMIEIAPLANVLTPDDVSSVTPVNAPHSEAVNATVTQDALLNARARKRLRKRRHPAVNCQRCLDWFRSNTPTGIRP